MTTETDPHETADRETEPATDTPKRAGRRKQEPKVEKTPEVVPGVGGMIKKRWAGKVMWECPRCLGTTFSEAEARVHQCKVAKFAHEEGLTD